MPSNRLWLYLALAAWVGLLAVPFFLSPVAPVHSGRVLTIISPHSPEVLEEFIEAFEADMAKRGTPVKVEKINVGGTAEIQKRVKNDFLSITSDPDAPPAPVAPASGNKETKTAKPVTVYRKGMIDIMWGGGTSPYLGLAKDGALDEYLPPPEIDEKIPLESAGVVIKPKNHLWIGSAFAGFGIVVNREICRQEKLPEPGDWIDLADPRYFNRFGNGDIRQTGAIKQCYEAVLQSQGWDKGWEILTCIGGNTTQFYRGSSQIPEEVGMGNIAVGFSIDRPALSEINRRGPETIAFILPPMTIINPDAMAILKGAPEPELAREFMNFVLSERGQSLWILKPAAPGAPAGTVPAGTPRQFALRRMPVRPEVYKLYAPEQVDVLFNPFDASAVRTGSKPFTYDDNLATKRQIAMPLLAGCAMIDTHKELIAAWQRVIKDGLQADAVKALAEMPISQADLNGIEAKWGKDTKAKETTVAAWQAFFLAKYKRIAAEGK